MNVKSHTLPEVTEVVNVNVARAGHRLEHFVKTAVELPLPCFFCLCFKCNICHGLSEVKVTYFDLQVVRVIFDAQGVSVEPLSIHGVATQSLVHTCRIYGVLCERLNLFAGTGDVVQTVYVLHTVDEFNTFLVELIDGVGTVRERLSISRCVKRGLFSPTFNS